MKLSGVRPQAGEVRAATPIAPPIAENSRRVHILSSIDFHHSQAKPILTGNFPEIDEPTMDLSSIKCNVIVYFLSHGEDLGRRVPFQICLTNE